MTDITHLIYRCPSSVRVGDILTDASILEETADMNDENIWVTANYSAADNTVRIVKIWEPNSNIKEMYTDGDGINSAYQGVHNILSNNE